MARDDFNRALALQSTPYAYVGLAVLYQRLGATENASANYRSAVELEPAFGESRQAIEGKGYAFSQSVWETILGFIDASS